MFISPYVISHCLVSSQLISYPLIISSHLFFLCPALLAVSFRISLLSHHTSLCLVFAHLVHSLFILSHLFLSRFISFFSILPCLFSSSLCFSHLILLISRLLFAYFLTLFCLAFILPHFVFPFLISSHLVSPLLFIYFLALCLSFALLALFSSCLPSPLLFFFLPHLNLFLLFYPFFFC